MGKEKGTREFLVIKTPLTVREVVEGSGEIQVKYLTLYTFSTENWNRPKEEVER